jgi:hypothetical protein
VICSVSFSRTSFHMVERMDSCFDNLVTVEGADLDPRPELDLFYILLLLLGCSLF